jgi:ZIP family zinc transporter
MAGSFSRLSHHAIALAMSVGAGLLLAAASLELAAEAVRIAGPGPAVVSLLLGAAVLSAANALLARFGAAHRKRCGGCTPQPSESQQPGSGVAIALGTALDAVTEGLVLGLALRERAVALELVIAISVGNLPEALSGAAGMRSAGRSYRYILLLWGAIAMGAAVATAAGYAAFGALGQSWPPRLQAFGAGAAPGRSGHALAALRACWPTPLGAERLARVSCLQQQGRRHIHESGFKTSIYNKISHTKGGKTLRDCTQAIPF